MIPSVGWSVPFDVGCSSNCLVRRLHLKVVWTDLNANEWHKGQVTADEASFHRGELELIGFDVNVGDLQLAFTPIADWRQVRYRHNQHQGG